jgi:hypothetical protein
LTGNTETKNFSDGDNSYTNHAYNAGDDATIGGSNNQTSITPADEFTDLNLATFDAHLKSGGDCEGNAGTLSGFSYTPSEDIDDESIGDDIGCDTLSSEEEAADGTPMLLGCVC